MFEDIDHAKFGRSSNSLKNKLASNDTLNQSSDNNEKYVHIEGLSPEKETGEEVKIEENLSEQFGLLDNSPDSPEKPKSIVVNSIEKSVEKPFTCNSADIIQEKTVKNDSKIISINHSQFK